MNITIQNSEEIFNEINGRLWDIPFDNSQFQNENFIINSALTPERSYRSAALRLQNRLNALKDAKFKSMKDDVKKRQLKHKIENERDEFEKELLCIELLELEANEPYTAKLINDAIVESNQLYNFIQSCPKYTREEFEKAERGHFEQRLLQEANGITGALKSLVDMGVDMNALKQGQLQYKEQEDALRIR